MKKPKTAVLVLGYNSQKYLKDCFLSLTKAKTENIDLVYIDNNSGDNSLDYLRKNFPKVEILANRKNLGFAAGYNQAIKWAIKKGYDYLFLLNPDTITDQNCLRELAKKADQNTILQPLVLIHSRGKKTKLINTSGNNLNFLGMSYCGDYRHQKRFAREKEIVSASGAAMFAPATIFKKIGFLDGSFFMYHEDLDFCWRARLAGFEIKLIPKAIIWHKYNFGRNWGKFFYVERNRQMFLLKNFSAKTLLLVFPIWLINELAILFYALINGWFWLKIKSYFSFLKYFPQTLQSRSKIQIMRVKSDADLKKFISGKISFIEVKIPLLSLYNQITSKYWLNIKKLI